MKTDRFEDQGETRYFTKVVARTVQFLSDRRDDEHLIESADLPEEEEPELANASEV